MLSLVCCTSTDASIISFDVHLIDLKLHCIYRLHVGGFLAGLVVPRDGGLAIALTEKLEDMVTIIFLPLVCRTHISALLRLNSSPFAVFHHIGPFYKSWITKRWYHLGLYNCDMHFSILWQV